ncbi:hypothetical protein ACHQM5_007293 [Ranunculus cassubicifolius]
MENSYSGGSWMMIPNNTTPLSHSSSNQDLSLTHLQQQQLLLNQQQQQQQQRQLQQQQQQLHQQQQQQQQNHQSLASHFHLKHLVENLADVIEIGTRDNHSDVLVNELTNNFDKCQQLLNSISGSISTKAMTVEGQKRKLEESEELLNQRRELITKYRSSVDELIKENR